MTNLQRKGVVRVTEVVDAGRKIVIRLEEGGKLIRFRLMGTRQWYDLHVQTAYIAAVRTTREQKIAAKKRERAALRAARR